MSSEQHRHITPTCLDLWTAGTGPRPMLCPHPFFRALGARLAPPNLPTLQCLLAPIRCGPWRRLQEVRGRGVRKRSSVPSLLLARLPHPQPAETPPPQFPHSRSREPKDRLPCPLSTVGMNSLPLLLRPGHLDVIFGSLLTAHNSVNGPSFESWRADSVSCKGPRLLHVSWFKPHKIPGSVLSHSGGENTRFPESRCASQTVTRRARSWCKCHTV